MKRVHHTLIIWLSCLMLLLWAVRSFAALPEGLSYQGYLTDSNGNPLDSAIPITFSLYHSSGPALWTENQTVTISNGLFTVQLGNTGNPLPATLFDEPVWLGINVNGDGEMTPRKALTSVGFAFRAQQAEIDADTLAELGCSANEVARYDGSVWGCSSYAAGGTNSTLFIKSNGQNIGVLDQMNDLWDGSYGAYTGLSFSEYYFTLQRQSGTLSPRSLVFTTSNCTGQPYSTAGDEFDPDPGPFIESQGRVYSSPPGYSLPVYYIPRGATSEVITVMSRWLGTDAFPEPCMSMNIQLPVFMVLANEPATTGVQNSYAVPIYAGF